MPLIDIVPFAAAHAEAFYRLNRTWLDAHDLYEPADEPYIAEPQRTIIDCGGEVWIALQGDHVVGTAAIVPYRDHVWELLKLTVAEQARGHGLGRRLVELSLERAGARGATRLVLVSSSKLQSALRLYERMGFVHAPLPADVPYATADVFMFKDL